MCKLPPSKKCLRPLLLARSRRLHQWSPAALNRRKRSPNRQSRRRLLRLRQASNRKQRLRCRASHWPRMTTTKMGNNWKKMSSQSPSRTRISSLRSSQRCRKKYNRMKSTLLTTRLWATKPPPITKTRTLSPRPAKPPNRSSTKSPPLSRNQPFSHKKPKIRALSKMVLPTAAPPSSR